MKVSVIIPSFNEEKPIKLSNNVFKKKKFDLEIPALMMI